MVMKEKGIWFVQTDRIGIENKMNVLVHGAIWICHGEIMFRKLDVEPFLCPSMAEVETMMLCWCLKPQKQMTLHSIKHGRLLGKQQYNILWHLLLSSSRYH